ncbi:MAG: hypothetical protein CBB92_04445, partial [Flammeovirgaceae bacterium TMED32]
TNNALEVSCKAHLVPSAKGGAIRGTLAGSRLAGQTARADDDLLTEEQLNTAQQLLRQPR